MFCMYYELFKPRFLVLFAWGESGEGGGLVFKERGKGGGGHLTP